MDNAGKEAPETEQIPHSFQCCVCLDLLYKPAVLSCGHISCFWCVHESMNGVRESLCPICRHPYIHFPTVCEMLHFLLLKMFPIAYGRREEEILEEERKRNCFSPQFGESPSNPKYGHIGGHTHSQTVSLTSKSLSDSCSPKKGKLRAIGERIKAFSLIRGTDTSTQQQKCDENCELIKTVDIEEKNLPENKANGNYNQISAADVQCAACKQMLFRPLVLNCGHVYCEACIIMQEDEMIRCQVCKSLHPSGFPKICLEFDHFLEERFPKEYALKRDAVKIKQAYVMTENQTTYSTNSSKEGHLSFLVAEGEKVDCQLKPHYGVGCDYCGMYPIIGDRYKCQDCFEKIGFDLCGYCYNTRSKLPGRFNQKHTPEHKLKLV